MPQWTAEQEKVISSDARKLVCSAAAGSGKTAVMVERVVRMIEEGKDPYSFLVITFTNAAAAEMKEKIRKRLLTARKDPVMEVCTIHAFCQHLIRQEFQIAEVDPLFQICTSAQRDSLFENAFRTYRIPRNIRKRERLRSPVRVRLRERRSSMPSCRLQRHPNLRT